jgi:hypothetical protein
MITSQAGFAPIAFGDADVLAEIASDGESLTLTVRHANTTLVERALLGITINGVELGGDCTLRGYIETMHDESFEMTTGKAAGPHVASHREHSFSFTDRLSGAEWLLIVRLARDGIAFRYGLPGGDGEMIVGPELTSFPLSGAHRAWVLDYQTWYETPRFGSDISALAEGEYGFPILVGGAGDSHMLLTESAIDGRFSGAHAVFTTASGPRFTVRAADDEYRVPAGSLLPWRVLIVGSLDTIVASSLVDELAPATTAVETSWIRPGRAAWSWWSSQYSGAYLEHQIRFTDYAASRGWEHILVDCGWDETWMPELVAHASRRGVQVHVWSSWSDLDGAKALEKLELWRSWGVAGIKVDFMESESQERYKWYDAIIAESQRVGLMVNFHGSVIPRGWARTFPHIMSYEGIRGAEYYVFYGDPLTAAHNVIQPFTRNVVGSMDYTPVTFSAPKRETTDAHELALGVAFESGIVHFADEVNEYAARPLAESYLAEIAPEWHETRLIGGTPDSHAIIARRNADRWWVGCIAAGEPRTVRVDLAFLGAGEFTAWSVMDAQASGLVDSTQTVRAGDIMSFDLRGNGGFVMLLAPVDSELRRARERALRQAPAVSPAVQLLGELGTATILADAAARLRLPGGWTAVAREPVGGTSAWELAAPSSFVDGALAVITVELAVPGDPVVVSHARIVAPLRAGTAVVSRLPFLACSNAVGPVERDMSNGGGDPRDGRAMIVAGIPYVDGLGVSAPSSVALHLGQAAARFTGQVGVDDETPTGAATATVIGDGVVLAAFGLLGGSPAKEFDIDVAGVTVLELSVVPAASADETHVDWAELRLEVTGV